MDDLIRELVDRAGLSDDDFGCRFRLLLRQPSPINQFLDEVVHLTPFLSSTSPKADPVSVLLLLTWLRQSRSALFSRDSDACDRCPTRPSV